MEASQRLETVYRHLAVAQDPTGAFPSPAASTARSPDDVVIVRSVRTAIGRAKRGSFRNSEQDRLLRPLFEHVLKTTPQLDPKDIGDIVIGNVLPKSSQGATQVRIAGLLAGIPVEVPSHTLNRQCSSGLQAIASVAAAIQAGHYDVGIAGGVEVMSITPMSWDAGVNEEALGHPMAMGCYMSMGQTSENVAERFGVSRQQQDELAVKSHQRAAAAAKAGRFAEEIVPVTVTVEDPKTGESKEVTVSHDEGIRENTTMEGLGKLRTVFKADGTTTAGNSSQVSDGASVALLMRRAVADRLGLAPMASLRSFAAVGVEPSIMGVGPAAAIPAAVAKAGLTLGDIDVFEINEAFASQAVYCVEKLGLSWDKVNPNGGAIALGHPLGCTGARMTATLLHELKRRKARYGVVSMCIGSGMGAAAVYENEM